MNDYSNKKELLDALEEEVKCLSQQHIDDDDASQDVFDGTSMVIFLVVVILVLIRRAILMLLMHCWLLMNWFLLNLRNILEVLGLQLLC
jgi:hypothetical protein